MNILQNEFLQSTSVNVSTHTLQQTLHEEGYYARVGKRKPFVSEPNRKIRLNWAKERLNWTSECETIIWSDESRFEVYGGDGRTYVWRLPNEKYDVNCLVPTFKSGRRGVMVWGCFTAHGLGPLIRVNGRQTSKDYVELLETYLLPFLDILDPDLEYTFQDDNAPIHRARIVHKWLEENQIVHLPWPAQSPDLNPIENIWDELERRVRGRIPLPTSEAELFSFLEEEWYNIDESVYHKLVSSMPDRLYAVKKAKGNPSKY